MYILKWRDRLVGYGFLPTLISIAFGVFPASWSVVCGVHGNPSALSADASATRAGTAALSSGEISTSTPVSYAVPAVDPAALTSMAPCWEGVLTHPADLRVASKAVNNASGSESGYTLKLNLWPKNDRTVLSAIRCCCSVDSLRGSFSLASSSFASAAPFSASAARALASGFPLSYCFASAFASAASLLARDISRSNAWAVDLDSACRRSSMDCCMACSFRLFHQVLIPKTDSPATPTTTSIPKTSNQISKLSSSLSSPALRSNNPVISEGSIARTDDYDNALIFA